MNKKLVLYTILILIIAGGFSLVFPYPVFSHSTNLTSKEQSLINDRLEIENSLKNNSKAVKVLSLNWFNYINSLFLYNTPTKIIDVETGNEYYVVRTGGTNHADVEPLNAQSAQIFQELYGGEQSWARRAVWVEIDGRYFAASINGMPHGYKSHPENPLNGHSCIHFEGSKTHGTKKVDPEHQKAVNIALSKQNKLKQYLFA